MQEEARSLNGFFPFLCFGLYVRFGREESCRCRNI